MKTRYIFIVGLPRTGTKLIINILSRSSSKIYISPETHFVGHLIRPGLRKKMKSLGDMTEDVNVCKFVDLLYSDQVQDTYWKALRSGALGIHRKKLLDSFLESDRSDRGMFEVIMHASSQAAESEILGEKSPAHLYHVPTLLKWFPDAKIIHTLRDPRAVLVSELKKRKKSQKSKPYTRFTWPFHSLFILMHVTFAWQRAFRLDERYSNLYPSNYYLSKFEDIIIAPDMSIRRLCEFLEIEFQLDMLSIPTVDSSFSNEQKTRSGFDVQTLDRWKKHIAPWMNKWFIFWGKKTLQNFGYSQ